MYIFLVSPNLGPNINVYVGFDGEEKTYERGGRGGGEGEGSLAGQ